MCVCVCVCLCVCVCVCLCVCVCVCVLGQELGGKGCHVGLKTVSCAEGCQLSLAVLRRPATRSCEHGRPHKVPSLTIM